MRVIRYLFSALPFIFLAACSHQSAVDQSNASNCSTDPYLAKYHCSFPQVQKAAEAGDSDAAYALGYMYYYGIDTPRDLDSAQVWIGRAAAQGQPLAKQAQVVIGVAKPPVVVTTPLKPVSHVSAMPRQKQPVVSALQRESLKKSTIVAHTGYTLQLMGTRHLSEIQAFVRAYHLQQKATYYEATYHSGQWYMLIYGEYATWREAHLAAVNLSSHIPGLKPWVKPNREVNAEVASHHVL